jgi:fructose-1,6-bisphosphatase II
MKNIMLDLIHATESAAIAASNFVGSGDKLLADKAATDAMESRLATIENFVGNIRIGEGKKDCSYGLFKGDIIYGPLSSVPHTYDVACDPIDGTNPTVNSGPEAMSVIAISESGTMYDTEEYYMLKMSLPLKIASQCSNLDLDTPLPEICKKVAAVQGKPVNKLMVCILNRPRHDTYIKQMRELGVRIKLIQDCDISGAIASCLPDNEIDIQFGIGGAPEAVITAAAMKCLGGFFLGKIWKDGKFYGPQLANDDFISGDCVFSATGITNGSLLKGVRFDYSGKPITNSVCMRSKSGTIRWLTTHHGN